MFKVFSCEYNGYYTVNDVFRVSSYNNFNGKSQRIN
jgi:hypothetical protein